MTDQAMTTTATTELAARDSGKAVTMFSKDPNARRHEIRAVMSMVALPTSLIGIFALACVSPEGSVVNVTLGFILMTVCLVSMGCLMFYNQEPTPYLDNDHRNALTRLINGLTTACRSGLEAPARADLQRQLDLFSQIVSRSLREDPWFVAAHARVEEKRPLPDSIQEMAFRLKDFDHLAKDLSRPGGTTLGALRHSSVNMVPLIAGIGREFGLDISAYEPPVENLPGRMLRPAIASTETPDVPVSRARSLAERWLAGDRSTVDELVRIEADAAAGRDLRQLEEAWVAARAAAPERIEEIDARYNAALDRLAETLSDALDARGQAAIDVLDTHGRYIASKSGASTI